MHRLSNYHLSAKHHYHKRYEAAILGTVLSPKPSPADKLKTALVQTAGRLLREQKGPDRQFGELFQQVQHRRVFSDGKTFADLVPRKRAQVIMRDYHRRRQDPRFNVEQFVKHNFYEFAPHKHQQHTLSTGRSARQHVRELWPQLVRRNRKARGSLLALPYPYVVPGGRFSEQFYWDTYFIMLGLAADGYWDMIEGMVKNYAYMLSKYGYIPTANRSYFLSRSQPPFFSHMLRLLATERGRATTYFTYLPHMLTEYRFWMRGRQAVVDTDGLAARHRIMKLPCGLTLNRYYDSESTPRPESQREDIATAQSVQSKQERAKLFLDLRAGAESGWDFSSRWLRDEQELSSIHTTDIVPVDLNCLLYDLECLIADTYTMLRQPLLARKFRRFAARRARALQRYCWDEATGFFYDYDAVRQQVTGRPTLAACYMLWSGIVSPEQAQRVKVRLESDFLAPGGLLTTLVHNGQQWDHPNGWAPLQWVAIQGLQRYGFDDCASEVRRRWCGSVEHVFRKKQKMIEKYDVMGESRVGGGGEYPLQDGFGWTNGVYAALYDQAKHQG